MIWPVPGYYEITSGYHDQRDYGLHGGFDIAAPDVPCVAIGAGRVLFTGWAGAAGRSIYIELDNGFRVHYCHLSRIDVSAGARVAEGDVLGLVGGSGFGLDNYYGSHLHLNLFAATQPATGSSHWVAWVGMYAVDPELYLKEDEMGMTQAQIDLLNSVADNLTRVDAQLQALLTVHNNPQGHPILPTVKQNLDGHRDQIADLQKQIDKFQSGSGAHSH